MKKLTFLFLLCSLIAYKGYSQTYYVISVQEEIFVGGVSLKAKDKLSADAVLKFSNKAASAIIFSPLEGKFVLSAHALNENNKGELIAKLSETLIPTTQYYFLNTRAGTEITADEFGESLYDNPAESEVISVLFVDKEPFFALPVPKNLLRKDSYFFLKSQTTTIPIPINDGKLVFTKIMQDDKGKEVDLMSIKLLFDFFYHIGSPPTDHEIGKVRFAIF